MYRCHCRRVRRRQPLPTRRPEMNGVVTQAMKTSLLTTQANCNASLEMLLCPNLSANLSAGPTHLLTVY
jgi:hypothetical protein